jgi:hypothetical protein
MDCLYPSKAVDAEHIHAVILSDDDSIDDGTEPNEDYVEPRDGNLRRVQKTLPLMIIAAMKWMPLTVVSLERTRLNGAR